MTVPLLLPSLLPLLLLLLSSSSLVSRAHGQDYGEQCLARFKHGRSDFILATDDSVKDGATYLASPKVTRSKDCVLSCCKNPKCNVAFMERGAGDGLIKSCFLFDCLYKKKYVCRFVRKADFINYFLDSVYESDLAMEAAPDQEDSPPVANGGSDRVVQPQDGVTLNGIESKDDQSIVSYEWQMLSGNPYAVITPTSFTDQVIVTNLTSGVYKFQLTVVDSIGQAASTKVTVLVLTPEQSEDHCMAPAKVGPCRGHFPRWQYNGASSKCEEFIYGGCRMNLNNYLTFDECANACESSGKSGRSLPIPKVEICGAACTAEQFTCANDCCLDAGLDCDEQPQCSDGSDEENCDYLKKKFNILLKIPVDENKVHCTEPPLVGECRDSITKWYYNPLIQDCVRFNYGGCQGNDNRFENKENCIAMCNGVTEQDILTRKDAQTGEDNTGIVAGAILLGIAIVAMLVVLGYCFMKGKRRAPQHQRVATNGTQVTTMEDTERLVYNSTTKPV